MDGKKIEMETCKPNYKFQSTINGYLNFLSEFKKRFCGIFPHDLIRFGAREWNQLTLQEKERFENMKEPGAVLESAPQVFESKSHGDSPDKSDLVKSSPVRSPYARERESRNRKERKPSKSIKKLVKKKAGPPSFQPKNRGFIPFMRRFQRMNKDLAPNDLLKNATSIWCRLHGSQRKRVWGPL
ncbi:protamine-like protein 99C [Drosophila subpulchrella]|uniref:protamine-like protein 99C n=1 Tax=Drosophila subpulchrella TaxID=1486046 RepID=UPI0018A1A7A3|nr:protamine-like protein 99C [Drosophila subpulchrella]